MSERGRIPWSRSALALCSLGAAVTLGVRAQQPPVPTTATGEAGRARAEPRAPDKKARRQSPQPAGGPPGAAQGNPPAGDEADKDAPTETKPAAPPGLPEAHRPRLSLKLQPPAGVKIGELVQLLITADALEGDDVTVPEQSFGDFEVFDRSMRVEPTQDGRQRFLFRLGLLALTPGDTEIPAVRLRVVTKPGVVGQVHTAPKPIKVASVLGNEPDAKPKPATKPIRVMQDDYTLLWIGGGLLGAAVVALLTLLGARWWRRRAERPAPPPPPAPPWELALQQLRTLRTGKRRYLDEDRTAEFVDRTSDVVRDYLGARFGFEGLESTTDEVIQHLKTVRGQSDALQDVLPFLNRCDLVKFAKLEPDEDEADLVLAKAFDIVRFTVPNGGPEPKPGHAADEGATSADSTDADGRERAAGDAGGAAASEPSPSRPSPGRTPEQPGTPRGGPPGGGGQA